MKNNRGIPILIIIVIITVAAVLLYYFLNPKEEKLSDIDQPDTSAIQLSVWLADWTGDTAVKEAKYLSNRLDSMQLFGVYFNELHELLIRDDFDTMYQVMQQDKKKRPELKLYATIVNDIVLENGTSEQKSPDLVSQLLKDTESRRVHVNEILQLLDRYELDGIELDYERIKDNDWEHMSLFIKQLYNELSHRGKSLRVVLEPKAPIERIKLPAGPEYVMMAYNLYGTHSDAGPKADISMIRKIIARFDYLPGDTTIAFATGGFDWSEDGKIKAVTEQQAKEIQGKHKANEQRDEKSGAQSFIYKDDKGLKHELWYADKDTLSLWISTAIRAGNNHIAIWRVGGLDQLSLDYLLQL